jgi:hypothetical protein
VDARVRASHLLRIVELNRGGGGILRTVQQLDSRALAST